MARLYPLVASLALSAAATVAAADRVRVEGSDTIGGSLGIALAEAFHARHPEIPVEWEGLGSATAFVGLFDLSTDLGASSRPINESEMAEAKRLALQLKEYVIAYDGMAVFVHPSNPVPSLTIPQLSEIFQGRVRDWREVGGPNRPIRLLSRPTYSGTHAFFRDKVLRRGNARGPEEFAGSVEWIEHTADIVDRVAADPTALSYGGMAYVTPEIRTVPVAWSSGQPPVASTAATVRDGSYPIFRPLLLYSRGEPQGAARELLAFILSTEGQRIVAEVGFVPADDPQGLVEAALGGAGRSAPPAPAPGGRRVEQSPGFAEAKRRALEAQARRRAEEAGQEALADGGRPVDGLMPAAAEATVAPPPAAPPAPASRVLRVYFPFGSVQLGPEALETVAWAAGELRRGAVQAVLVGHADAQGSRAANLAVSRARAQAVREALLLLGAPAALLSLEAAASDKPIATNETAEGRRGNRRVDIFLLPSAEGAAGASPP